MTSGITSSYSTIQAVSEEPVTPKTSDHGDGQETSDIQATFDQLSCISPNPSGGNESESLDDGGEAAETSLSSVQPSHVDPGPADNTETKDDGDSRLNVKPSPADNKQTDVTASPVPQPRTKRIIHVSENQTVALESTNEASTSDSTKAPPLQSTYVLATEPTAPIKFVKNAEVKRSSSLPRPERPPPPVGYYGKRPSTPRSTKSSDNDDGQESSVSSDPSPVSPGPPGQQGPVFGVYRAHNEDSEKPAIPPRPPLPKQPYASSASLASQMRPPPPSFNPPPPPSDEEPLYNEIQFPAYLHILPEHDKRTISERPPNAKSRSSPRQSSMDCTQEMMEMLRWLKVVSKTDYMTPSLYGVSLEEEIRSFHHTALNIKKALRLFNLLMMKRSEVLRDYIAELTSTSDALDKALKRKKTIQLAGGTTGAVGGVTAVVGLALAPVTMGASLIATAVGAGMVASAGGVSARVAKAKKKIITRDGVNRLVNDYIDKSKDIEHCLNFILSGMNELRRYDIARLQRAGAQPDTLKIAHLTHSVFNSIETVRRNSATQAGGMSSERLLQGFAKELDYYFTEKDGQKLKKSRKSRFSGRVRLLAENLQDELDYLNHMWELFN